MKQINEIGNCLNCNKEFIKLKKVKDHKFCCKNCKTDHCKKNPKMETVVCSNCNKEYIRRKQSRYNNNYCCLDCEKEFKHNKKWEFRKCEICNEDFECKKISTQKFCSNVCQGKWQSTQIGILNPRFTSEIISCDWCAIEYYAKQYKINDGKYHFCSENCRQTWYSEVWSQSEEWKQESSKRAVTMLESGIFNHVDTNIQIIINDILDDLKIPYINEKGFVYCAVDNYLDKHNLIIEVMGGYWHCDSRIYATINYETQVNRIKMDKIKHSYIKNEYDIEILYLWEQDINDNPELIKELIKLYIINKGELKNYHSFNYVLDNNEIIINNVLLQPYMEWEKSELNNIIDLSVKEQMCRKQLDKWIIFQCEQCGKDKEELISHYNKKEHHYCSIECSSLAHSNKVSVICNNCQSHFEVIQSKFNKNKLFFCNQQCQHEYQQNIGFGEKITFNCDGCNVDVTQKLKDYNKTKLHFCSKECRDNTREKEKYIIFSCENCGVETKQLKSLFNRNNHHFCSPSCSTTYNNKNRNK